LIETTHATFGQPTNFLQSLPKLEVCELELLDSLGRFLQDLIFLGVGVFKLFDMLVKLQHTFHQGLVLASSSCYFSVLSYYYLANLLIFLCLQHFHMSSGVLHSVSWVLYPLPVALCLLAVIWVKILSVRLQRSSLG